MTSGYVDIIRTVTQYINVCIPYRRPQVTFTKDGLEISASLLEIGNQAPVISIATQGLLFFFYIPYINDHHVMHLGM